MNDNWQRKKIQANRTYWRQTIQPPNSLIVKKRQGKRVTLTDDQTMVEFVSSGYLGLDSDPRITAALTENAANMGVAFPVRRTQLRSHRFTVLEALLQRIFCGGHPILFATRHLSHLGGLPLLASGEMPSFPLKRNGAYFIMDKSVDASIHLQRNLLQKLGRVVFIDIQKKARLQAMCNAAQQQHYTPIVVANGVGFLGDTAPVDTLIRLAEQYDGYVYLDDVHGTSLCGQQGAGYVLWQLGHRFHPRLLLTISLANAFGTAGAVMLLPTRLDVTMIKRFASAYMSGDILPLPMVEASIASAKIHCGPEIVSLQGQLQNNLTYFDVLSTRPSINANTVIPIRNICIGDEAKAVEYSQQLQARGYLVDTVLYPIVMKEKALLRIALSTLHTPEQIRALCEHIEEIMRHNYSN